MKPRDNPGYNRDKLDRDRWTLWDPAFHGNWTPAVRDIDANGKLGDAYTADKHTSELYADAAVEFLETSKQQTKPFLMFVTFNAPHDPRQSPRSFVQQYPADKQTTPTSSLPPITV